MKKILACLFLAILLIPIGKVNAASYQMHTVQEGESFFKLSQKYNQNIAGLQKRNGRSSNDLYTGELIEIKPIQQTIKVIVNQQKLNTDVDPYIENGSTFVPIRFIGKALDVDRIAWNQGTKTAKIVYGNKTISLTIGENRAIVNGVSYPLQGTIQLYNNRTFVPIRFVSEILDCTVDWNASSYSVLISKANNTVPVSSVGNNTDLYWLSRIVNAEAEGESYQGKLAVANVILNRKNSDLFPNTIKEVVFDSEFGIQFTPVADGTIYNEPSNESIQAAKDALNGKNNIGDSLYFLNPEKAVSAWIQQNRSYRVTLGNHDFYY